MGALKRNAAECGTLAEYRIWVLRMSQEELARRANCKQSWISAVERGHLPRPKNWDRLLGAYQLADEEFVRMVRAAALIAELRRGPAEVREQYPLFAAGPGVGEAPARLQEPKGAVRRQA